MERTHLLCYIRRDRLTSWKLDSLERGTRNRPVLAYGSGAANFSDFARRGNVLWVVGANAGGPPTLEAKIQISGQLQNPTEYDCEVKGTLGGSGFFGLNDASSALMQLVFKSESSIWSLRDKYSTTRWRNAFGQELQSPRRLATEGDRVRHHRSPGATPLEQLEYVLKTRSVFISWKHSDNNQNQRGFLGALCRELAKRQFSVWWDKMALTNVDAVDEYSKRKKDELMDRLLRQGLSQSTAILALWTKKYGTCLHGQNWTANEWCTRGKRIRFAMSAGDFERKPLMREPDHILCIPHHAGPADAIAVARRFQQAFESISGQFRK